MDIRINRNKFAGHVSSIDGIKDGVKNALAGYVKPLYFRRMQNNTALQGHETHQGLTQKASDSLQWLGKIENTEVTFKTNSETLLIRNILCTVTLNIKVITTAVTGRNGTIKESFGTGDFDIVFDGFIDSGFVDEFNRTDFTKLISILNSGAEVQTDSDYLRRFGITQVVFIGKQDFKQSNENVQAFKLIAISDIPYELQQKYDEDEEYQKVMEQRVTS